MHFPIEKNRNLSTSVSKLVHLQGLEPWAPLIKSQGALPTELKVRFGAGDGNRTHVASLEGWNSTIELHPHSGAVDETGLATSTLARWHSTTELLPHKTS